MLVERLDIRGYRRLHGTYDFAAALTLVAGPNEAGKSTLHDALLRSLFGFSPEERRRRDGSCPKDDRAPWAGGPFGLTLRARDLEDRAVLVRWDFAADEAEIHDALTGALLLREQPKQRHDHEIGEKLVGMTRAEFVQVCCLFQEALDTVHPTEDLRAALQRSVDAAPAEDTSVERADERLRRLLSSLGVHGGHYGVLAGGEMGRLLKEEEALQARRASEREQRIELDGIAARLAEAHAHRDELAQRGDVLHQASLRAAAQACEQRWTRAQSLLEQARDRPVGTTAVPRELFGREQELRSQVEKLHSRERTLQMEIASRADELSLQERALTAARERVETLGVYAGVDQSGEQQVRGLLASIKAAGEDPADPSEQIAPEADPVLARFREQRDELLALRSQRAAPKWNTRLLAAALILAAVGAAGGAVVSPALAVLLVAAAVCAWAARPRTSDGDSTPDALASFGGRSFDELDRMREDEDLRLSSFRAAHEAREQASSRQQQRLGDLSRELEAAVRAYAKDTTSETVAERAEEYLSSCDGARKLAEAAAEHQQIEARLTDLRAPSHRLEELKGEREARAGELTELYSQAGLDTQDPAAATAEFAQRAMRAQEDLERTTRADQASAALTELLGGANDEDLFRDLQVAKDALAEDEQAHGVLTLGDAQVDLASLAQVRSRVEGELAEADIEVARLQTTVGDRESTLPNPADLEVQLAQVQTSLERLQLERDAVRIAREALRKAAQDTHRRVAPHLNEALRRELPRITRGRYKDGTVDEDLAIKLYAPESGRLVSIEQLSRGTRDQVALVQRLEIAHLLDPTAGHTPLLLDDPFAHFDGERLRLGAELIAEVAERRQVVLFTEDTEVIRRTQEACPSCSVIELPDPVDAIPDTQQPTSTNALPLRAGGTDTAA